MVSEASEPPVTFAALKRQVEALTPSLPTPRSIIKVRQVDVERVEFEIQRIKEARRRLIDFIIRHWKKAYMNQIEETNAKTIIAPATVVRKFRREFAEVLRFVKDFDRRWC